MGGGIYNASKGTVTVTNSTFSNNSATQVPGYAATEERRNLQRRRHDGGGLYLQWQQRQERRIAVATTTGGNLTVNTCTFNNNTANGTPIPGYAPDTGGGADQNSGVLSVSASTISGNSAPSTLGGGIFNTNQLNEQWDQHQSDRTELYIYGDGHDRIREHGGCSGKRGPRLLDGLTYQTNHKTDIRTDDLVGNSKPLLGPLAPNGGPTETMALLPGSPAM